ncbi:MAG: PEP-CTERM sorting domain-containing protein [Planctomycetota bacterium]
MRYKLTKQIQFFSLNYLLFTVLAYVILSPAGMAAAQSLSFENASSDPAVFDPSEAFTVNVFLNFEASQVQGGAVTNVAFDVETFSDSNSSVSGILLLQSVDRSTSLFTDRFIGEPSNVVLEPRVGADLGAAVAFNAQPVPPPTNPGEGQFIVALNFQVLQSAAAGNYSLGLDSVIDSLVIGVDNATFALLSADPFGFTVTAIPEPATLSLFLAAAALVLRRSKVI